MIELYTWNTPNGRKVSILLEELGIDYQVMPVNIDLGEQLTDAFRHISPNGKIPALVDSENGLALMESGAIMIYLADKYRRFLSVEPTRRYHQLAWLMWQMAGFGPMLGQAHHFLHFHPGKSSYAEARYRAEAIRLYGVLERRLADRDYVGDEYSIADIAIWPWVARFAFHQIDLNDFPRVRDWYLNIAARPAVVRGYRVPDPQAAPPYPPG